MRENNPPSSQALPIPLILKNDIVRREVSFVNFQGENMKGEIEIHVSIEKDIMDAFVFMKSIGFPMSSVFPIEHFHNDDDASMIQNNSYAFCLRTITLKPHEISNHGYGVAIDINPVQNPYISIDGRILPSTGNYDIKKRGTLYTSHPVVKFFKERGFVWGGDWDKPYKDYQHFHKELSDEYMQKYQPAIQEVLENILGQI